MNHMFGWKKKAQFYETKTAELQEDLKNEREQNLIDKEDVREVLKINEVLREMKHGTASMKELELKMKIYAEGGLEAFRDRQTEKANIGLAQEKIEMAKSGLEAANSVSDKAIAKTDKLLEVYKKGKIITQLGK